jgi:hypothetical protein
MQIKIIKMSFFFVFGLLVASPQNAVAQSCLPFLTNQNQNLNIVSIVTLNKNEVASWSGSTVSYLRPTRVGQRVRPAQWVTYNVKDGAPQLFSDRSSGVGTVKNQPFDIAQADSINVSFTIEASPLVTVTFRSRGNTKATFSGTCSVGGVIHGSTSDTDYLLFLTQTYLR